MHTHTLAHTRLLMYFNTKDNFAIQKLNFLNLRAAIWKVYVTSVKANSCSQFSPLRSQSMGVCTLICTQLYCPLCLGTVQPEVELQVIKCIVVTSTVSWHRGQCLYSSWPLIAWVMLFLTFLCEGVLCSAWGMLCEGDFCLTPSDTFSGQTGTFSPQWIRSPATSQLSGEQPQGVVCPAFLSAHGNLQQQHLKARVSLQWS